MVSNARPAGAGASPAGPVLLSSTAVRRPLVAHPALFVIPSHGPSRPLGEHPEAWVLRALFAQQELPFVLVDIPPDQFLSGDFHPGPRGDETIAAAIEAALAEAPGVRRLSCDEGRRAASQSSARFEAPEAME